MFIFRLANSITESFVKNSTVSNKSVFSSRIFNSWPYMMTNLDGITKKSFQIKLDLMVSILLRKK